MMHKVRINTLSRMRYAYPLRGPWGWLWYVECRCGWEPETTHPDTGLCGRPTWDAAFALGVAHLKNADILENRYR